MSDLTSLEHIQTRILILRDQRVMLDADLAALYGVTTKRLNEQVKRNRGKFPVDFAFQLTREGLEKVRSARKQDAGVGLDAPNRSQNATGSQRHRDPRFLPWVFTEHGAIQAANVLNSETATTMSVAVMRAFVRLRQLVVNHKALAAKLAELDARVGAHDEQLAAIVEAIRQLTTPLGPEHDRKIGFHRGNR